MENRNNCSFCNENETTIRCHQCSAEYHLNCLSVNYRSGTELNRINCIQCRRQYHNDVINAIRDYGIPNIRNDTFFDGVKVGVITTISCIILGTVYFMGGFNSGKRNSYTDSEDD